MSNITNKKQYSEFLEHLQEVPELPQCIEHQVLRERAHGNASPTSNRVKIYSFVKPGIAAILLIGVALFSLQVSQKTPTPVTVAQTDLTTIENYFSYLEEDASSTTNDIFEF